MSSSLNVRWILFANVRPKANVRYLQVWSCDREPATKPSSNCDDFESTMGLPQDLITYVYPVLRRFTEIFCHLDRLCSVDLPRIVGNPLLLMLRYCQVAGFGRYLGAHVETHGIRREEKLT